MTEVDPPMGTQSILSLDGLRTLIEALPRLGYQVLGPTLRDGAIVYDEVASLADLPAGWTDQQDAGRYRLERRSDNALFGYAVDPQSWRRFLQQPVHRMWQAQRHRGRFHRHSGRGHHAKICLPGRSSLRNSRNCHTGQGICPRPLRRHRLSTATAR